MSSSAGDGFVEYAVVAAAENEEHRLLNPLLSATGNETS